MLGPLTACFHADWMGHPASQPQVDGVYDLLEMVDYLQAPHVKTVCDRVSGCRGRWVAAGG